LTPWDPAHEMRVSCVGLFCLYCTNKLGLGNYAQLEEYPYELG